jgi:tetratricopeptide (TPR) repeat protein
MPSTEDDLEHRYLAATAALERGDVEMARRHFEVILADAPEFAPAWDGLGNCYEAEDDLKKAGDCFRKAMRLDRHGWRSRYNWGVALHRAGEVDKACRWLSEAAKLAPQERRIHQRLGLCYSDLGDYEEALRCYRRALEQPERGVTDAELYVEIGNVERDRGELEAADKAYERACLFSPNDPLVYYNWAVVAARQGDPDGAERLAVRAHALDPRSTRHLLLLINLAMDAGRWEAAEKRIADLQGLPDTDRLVYALRAELARRTGNPARARALVLETLRMDGPPSDQAVDRALATLRHLDAQLARCHGFRLVLEVLSGEHSYFRPYVLLAENEDQARSIVAELQDELDDSPWRIVETETFPHEHEGETLVGVYHVLLTRVLFPRDRAEG